LRGWSAWNPDGSCAAGWKVDDPLMGNHDARARLIVPARAAPVPLGWGWGGLRHEGLSRSCTVTADQPDAILAVADDLRCRRGGVWAPSGVPCRSGGGSGASPAPSITRAANGAPLVGGRFVARPLREGTPFDEIVFGSRRGVGRHRGAFGYRTSRRRRLPRGFSPGSHPRPSEPWRPPTLGAASCLRTTSSAWRRGTQKTRWMTESVNGCAG